MHEMSYCIKLVNMALDAVDTSDETIESLSVSIGEMTGIVPEYLHKYFPEATKNTALEGAVLDIHMMPVIIKCKACGKEYTPSKENSYKCPSCLDHNGDLLQGREFMLDHITLRGSQN